MKKISTTSLSKNLKMSSRDLFDLMVENKLLYRKDDKWNLTKKGKEYGGEYVTSKNYGEYVVWPDNLNPITLKNSTKLELINATKIGKEFNLSSQRINLILSEIGWIEKAIKGWSLTKFGRNYGGVEFEHTSGATYVLWPKTTLQNQSVIDSISNKNLDSISSKQTKQYSDTAIEEFRSKFPANIRTKDGHQVRSRAEAIIDNALYDYGLAHAYERKLPIEEVVYSDFYIPSKNGGKAVYIEFWGMENEPKYADRKRKKKEIYSKYQLNLIELGDKHIENLDDHLPRMLLKYGIRVE